MVTSSKKVPLTIDGLKVRIQSFLQEKENLGRFFYPREIYNKALTIPSDTKLADIQKACQLLFDEGSVSRTGPFIMKYGIEKNTN